MLNSIKNDNQLINTAPASIIRDKTTGVTKIIGHSHLRNSPQVAFLTFGRLLPLLYTIISNFCQYLAASFGDGDGVLEVGRERAVLGLIAKAVFGFFDMIIPCRDHGLQTKNHTLP